MEDLVLKLYSIGALKIGKFEIKKNFFAPFQIDFSGVISHPQLAKAICAALLDKAGHLSFDLLCGVPLYGACLANFMAWDNDLRLVLRRVETRGRPIKIQGSYKTGQTCLVIQALITSGQETLQTIEDLENEGIKVIDTLAFIDLEIGGKKKIKTRGYVSHALIGIREVLQILYDCGKLAGDSYKLTTDFLENV